MLERVGGGTNGTKGIYGTFVFRALDSMKYIESFRWANPRSHDNKICNFL